MPKEEASFIKLLYLAIDNERSSVVDWDPNGKGFIVGNMVQFTTKILAMQFNISRLDSFARKLNRHGFKRSKIDRTKVRFFHKYFNRQSKNLDKIQKLSKYESLPKHIKLNMMRQELNRKLINNTISTAPTQDIVYQILQNIKTIKTMPDLSIEFYKNKHNYKKRATSFSLTQEPEQEVDMDISFEMEEDHRKNMQSCGDFQNAACQIIWRKLNEGEHQVRNQDGFDEIRQAFQAPQDDEKQLKNKNKKMFQQITKSLQNNSYKV